MGKAPLAGSASDSNSQQAADNQIIFQNPATQVIILPGNKRLH